MPGSHFFAKHKSKITAALILTFSSGMVDIIAFLGIYPLFTAHVTGTTVHMASNMVHGKGTEVIAGGAILLSFFWGSVLGRMIIHAGARRGFRRVATITLGIEAVLIAWVGAEGASWRHAGATMSISPGHMYLYVALLAGAMGMQTATLTGIGALTVHTTFLTGMVNKLSQLVSHIIVRGYDFRRGRAKTPENLAAQSAESKYAIFIFSIWVFYVFGALGGTASYWRWGIRALLIAVAGILIGIATDFFRPLSIEEEQEESER